MDPRLFIVLAALFVAAAGYVCLAPDQIPFLRLPQAFLQLGMERTVTGLSLMLLGFLVALSEIEGEKRPARTRSAQPFAFGEEELAPAAGELRLEPGPKPRPAAEPPTAGIEKPEPASRRRPDLYKDLEMDTLAVVPNRDKPAPPPEP